MKKFTIRKIFIFVLIAICVMGLSACSKSDIKTPADIIKDQYGDKEYRISFSSEGLDEPISDMTYTAKSIPVLPTPQKVGYVFNGWFFEKNYQTQFQNEILLMTMTDVTLYAKWTKENLETNGTYDIEYSAEILEDTIKEGSTAAMYGGYKKLPDNISVENTYLEKSDKDLLLKIEFDGEDLEPYGALKESYSVTVNATKNPSSVYIDEKISSLSETKRTIYIRMSEVDLSMPIYLDVETTNWKTEGLSDEDRYNTTTTYTVKFTINRLVGFRTPYVDTSVPLEDGYYLVRSYYKTKKNVTSMGDGFNSVFSYIKAKDGKYTLIKPFTPYLGLVKYGMGTLQEPYSSNLFYRLTSFMPVQYCFEVDTSDYSGEVASDYYPATYKAKNYLDYSVEFHTNDYKVYSIVDLGNNFKRELAFMSSVSGFMEAANGMGSGIQILYLDYDHIIKLSDDDVDYNELSGDNYSFETKESFYPGEYGDLNDKNLTYNEIIANGLSSRMTNFWYSATSDNAPYAARTVYNGKITFRPTVETNSNTVAESRYSVAHFNVETKIYGYDVKTATEKGSELYYDSMSVQTFGSSGLREQNKFRIGKTLSIGDTVSLEELYREKVSYSREFSSVEYKGYKVVSGKVDFSKEITVQKAFVFNEDIAILFLTKNENGEVSTTLVYMEEKTNPNYRISDDNHDWEWSDAEQAYISATIDKEGTSVDLPGVTYSWTGVNNVRFKSAWYEDETCINPLRVGIFSNQNGAYRLSYIGFQNADFTITKYDTYVLYEMVNVYGERSYIRFRYRTTEKDVYTITDGSGEVKDSGDVKYDEYGKIKDVSARESLYLTKDNFKDLLSREFYMTIGKDDSVRMNLVSFDIMLADKKGKITSISKEAGGEDLYALINEVDGYMNDYSWFTLGLTYSYFGNRFSSCYLYNVGFSGSKSTDIMLYDDYFTNTEYTMPIPQLFSDEGLFLGSVYMNVYHMIGGKRDSSFAANSMYSLEKSEYEFTVRFNEPGEFFVGFGFSLNGIGYSFGQELKVLSDKSDVTITYITDADHPFDNGLTQKTIRYNLTENIISPSGRDFSTSDILFGWTEYAERNATASGIVLAGKGISDFIGKYNSQNVVLYAIWDSGISIVGKSDGNADIRKSYLRNSSNGYYIVDLSKFKVYAPSGYVLAGWTGGFLGDSVKNGEVRLNVIEDSSDYLTIHAVFRKQFTVKYLIDSAFSDTVIRNDTVIEGFGLESNRTVVAKVGYRFVGWYNQDDETQTIIDLSTYKFTGNTTLVAKFERIAEDEA